MNCTDGYDLKNSDGATINMANGTCIKGTLSLPFTCKSSIFIYFMSALIIVSTKQLGRFLYYIRIQFYIQRLHIKGHNLKNLLKVYVYDFTLKFNSVDRKLIYTKPLSVLTQVLIFDFSPRYYHLTNCNTFYDLNGRIINI